MKKLLLLATLLTSLTSCYDSGIDDSYFEDALTAGKVIVGNEGGWNNNNASVSLFDPEEDTIYNQMFYSVNNFPLGDVLQSAAVIDEQIFFVVNNSASVIVANYETLKYEGTISGLTSPRYIAKAQNKLYITDLYNTSITIVDPTSFENIGSIELGTSSEQIISNNGYLYVCAWSMDNRIFKIDPLLDVVETSITVTDQPNSMRFDVNGKLWVLSGGAYNTTYWYKETAGALTCIDVNIDMFVESTLTFPSVDQNPSDLQISNDGKSLYYICSTPWSSALDGGIFKVGITESSIPSTAFISSTSTGLYGLGIDPSSGDVYVADAGYFVEAGTVTRYNSSGESQCSVTADIVPSFFVFM